jgi:hypothetical protein
VVSHVQPVLTDDREYNVAFLDIVPQDPREVIAGHDAVKVHEQPIAGELSLEPGVEKHREIGLVVAAIVDKDRACHADTRPTSGVTTHKVVTRLPQAADGVRNNLAHRPGAAACPGRDRLR